MDMSSATPVAEKPPRDKKPGKKSFSGLEVGQVFNATGRIYWWDILLIALGTRDFNPLHWNASFARKHGFQGAIAHGILTLGVVSRAFGNKLFVPGVKFLRLDATDFNRPVYPGNVLNLAMEVREIKPGRVPKAIFDFQLVNSARKIVCQGSATVSIPG